MLSPWCKVILNLRFKSNIKSIRLFFMGLANIWILEILTLQRRTWKLSLNEKLCLILNEKSAAFSYRWMSDERLRNTPEWKTPLDCFSYLFVRKFIRFTIHFLKKSIIFLEKKKKRKKNLFKEYFLKCY